MAEEHLPAEHVERPFAVLDVGSNSARMIVFRLRADEHLDVIPAVIAADAGTRSALLWVIGDVRFPASSITASRIVDSVVRRGPPRSFSI